MPGLDDVDLELDAIRAFHARRQAADAAVSGISEMQARAATVVHDYYRWLPPSVSLALASAGLGPDSDVTQRIAARLIGQGSSTDLAQVGEKVSPDELAASAANLDTSGLLAKAAYERYGVLYDTNARDGVTATSGQGGGGWLQGAKHAFLEDWDDPMSKVRGATRAMDAYGRFAPQFATGQYRNFRQQVADKGLMQTIRDDLTSPTTMFTNMARATLQTDIGAQAEQLTAGDRVESGSGFFMNDTKAAGMARRGNEMSFGPVETWGDGSKHAITIGRDIAGHLLGMEPGTRGYNLVSGLGDAAVQVAFMKPGMAASKERQAGQAFKGIVSVADDATALQRARASAGALWSPGRRMTYDATLAHSWVNGDGQKVAEAFSSIGSTHVLDQLTGGRLAPSTLAKLADAQTTEDVTKVLHDAVSAHELKSVVNASSWRRMRIDVRNGLPRFANRAMDIVPDSIIDLRDGRKALTEADRWASAMKLTEEQRGVLHDALSRVPDEPTFLGDGLDHFRAIEHEALVQKARASAVQQALRDASGNYMERYGRFKTIVDEGEAVHGAEKVYAAQRKLADARAKIDKVLRFGFDRGDEEVRYYQDELNQNHSFFGATMHTRYGDPLEESQLWGTLDHPTALPVGDLGDHVINNLLDTNGHMNPQIRVGDIVHPNGLYTPTSSDSKGLGWALQQMQPGDTITVEFNVSRTLDEELAGMPARVSRTFTGEEARDIVRGTTNPDISPATVISRWTGAHLKWVDDGTIDMETQKRIDEYLRADYRDPAQAVGKTGVNAEGTLEKIGEIGDSLPPIDKRALDDALAKAGLPEQVTVYRGYNAGNAPRGAYVNASLDRAVAEHFAGDSGTVVEMVVPRSAIVATGNSFESELIFRADAVGTAYSPVHVARETFSELQMPRRATPMLSSETVHGVLPMPNPEDVRRAFNSPLMQAWAKVPGVDAGTVFLEAMMDKWRTVNLLKPALGVRIIGDGQARLLAEGGDSIVAHPIRAIAWMLGDSRFSDEWFAHGRANMLGELFNREDEWASSLNKTTRGFWQDIRYKRIEGHKGFLRGQDGFEDAWHYQLSKLHATAPGQIAAESENLDAAIGKWWDLADVREQYAKAHPPARSLPDALSGDDLLHPQGAAAFMEDVSKRLRHMTQDDPRLIEAVRTGKLRSTDPGIVSRAREAGYPVTQVDGVETAVLPLLEGITPNPLVTDALKADEFAGVAAGFGNREIVGRVAKVEEAARGKLDRVVDALFAGLLGRPENYLSKSPVARQEYWNFVREHVAYLDPAEADAIVANAEKAGLARDQLRTIKRMAGKAGAGDDLLTAEEMHHLAEAHAAQRVRDILDDMSHRHQAFDMVKLIMPFGEAWHQVVTKWGKILAQPHVWPEMSVAARALRSPELGSVVEPENQSYDTSTGQMTTRGLFYPDENGNETVAFPLSRQMLGLFGDAKQALVGGAAPARVPIVGKVQGLSVGLDVMPGLGPVAQIPMAALMDRIDDPKYDGLRDILFPHGAPTGSTFQQVERGFVPSWLQKILKGNPTGFDDRAYASQVIDSMRYLASTGNYKVSGEGASQAEISRLIDDAKSQASTMALIRGLAQTTSPTAPAFDWEITDKDGKRVSALVLGRELHEMQSSSDPEVRDNAILSFLDKHGDGAFALLQGKSLSISPSGALPPTKEARAWLNANSFARGEYPLTYGLFAPNSPDAKFDGTTYFETLDAGDREQLDPEVALKLANRKVAQAAYYSIRGKMGSSLSAEQSVALYNFRKQLEQMYPGYSANGDDVPGAPTKASREQVLLELEKAAADPRFAKSELAEPLQAYMQLRKIAQDWSTTNYGRAETWATAKEGQAVRQVLFDTGRQIASEYPAFASAWETVLLPEFDNALVDQQGAN